MLLAPLNVRAHSVYYIEIDKYIVLCISQITFNTPCIILNLLCLCVRVCTFYIALFTDYILLLKKKLYKYNFTPGKNFY